MLRWNGRWLSMLRGGNLRKASQIRFSSNQPDPNASSSRITRILHFQPAGSPVGVFDRTLRWFVYAWAGFVGWHTWSHYFYTCDPTYGISMLPTLSSFGDWVIISKWYRRGRGIKVGDLVSFHHPVKEREHAVKRVVGLSGDLVLMNTPGKSDYMIQVLALAHHVGSVTRRQRLTTCRSQKVIAGLQAIICHTHATPDTSGPCL